MKPSRSLWYPNRRRFLALLAALGVSLPWLLRTGPSPRLSSREATFYRRKDGSRR